jgi:hypothetical protein
MRPVEGTDIETRAKQISENMRTGCELLININMLG